MSVRKIKQIGPYSVGEIPIPLQISFVDFDGNAIDLTGYTADFVIEKIDSELSTDVNLGQGAASIIVPETGGIAEYVWAEADFDNPGRFQAQMWVGNGVRRLASIEFFYDVFDVTQAPAI